MTNETVTSPPPGQPSPPKPTATAPAQVAGQTSLHDNVVEIIAGIAAREVAGVHKLGKGRLKDALHKVVGTEDTRRGVVAEVGRKELAVDLEMVVEYGFNLYTVAQRVRELVTERLEQMTGLSVKEVNIHVADVFYEADLPASSRVE